MYSLILSLAAALVVGGIISALGFWGWGIFVGLVIYVALMVLINRHYGKRLQALVEQVQVVLTTTQQQVQKVAQVSTNLKLLEAKVEQISTKGVGEAIALLDQAEPIYKWNMLAKKQVNTLKFQLHYQVKQWDDVDRLLPNVLLMEPAILAMKMSRLYMTDASPETIDALYRKGIKKFKYDKSELLIAVYSWILLKRKDTDKALAVLAEGKEKAESEVINANWQAVANGRLNQFSNAAIGDMWWGMHLEAPKQPKPTKGQMMQHPMHGKGKRRFF